MTSASTRTPSPPGADPRRAITVEAEDSDAPVASNRTLVGRRQNRRADVFVLGR
jgi:flagellar motor protein MotB